MKKGTVLLSFVFAIAAASAVAQDVGGEKNSAFVGFWSGDVYDTEENVVGSWTMDVSIKGKVSAVVSVWSPQSLTVTLKGKVNSKGKINLANRGIRLKGILNAETEFAEGTWSYKVLDGFWSGNREL